MYILMYLEESVGVFGVKERKTEPQRRLVVKVRMRSEMFSGSDTVLASGVEMI